MKKPTPSKNMKPINSQTQKQIVGGDLVTGVWD